MVGETRELLSYKEKRYFLLAFLMTALLSYLAILGASLPPNNARLDVTLQGVGVFVFLCGISYAVAKHGFVVVKVEVSQVR